MIYIPGIWNLNGLTSKGDMKKGTWAGIPCCCSLILFCPTIPTRLFAMRKLVLEDSTNIKCTYMMRDIILWEIWVLAPYVDIAICNLVNLI
jgi:hypothetical protein